MLSQLSLKASMGTVARLRGGAPVIFSHVAKRRFTPCAVAFQAQTPMDVPIRNYADFGIYKGKAAVQFKPIPPTFAANSGRPGQFQVDKEGVLLLEFAQAQASQQQGYGSRSYDWKNKVTFALNPLELSMLTDFDVTGPATNKASLDMMHDPNKGNPNAGSQPKTTKSLKLTPQPGGHADGYMLSINQMSGQQRTSISVPITRHEYVALKHLAAYLVPRLFGFDYLFELQGTVPAQIEGQQGQQ